MGDDGGFIGGRVVKVQSAKKKFSEPSEVARQQLSHCAMSGQPLNAPIVACELGHLYNKEVIIQYLLDKIDSPKFNHIRKLKDLINCHPTLISDKQKTQEGDDNDSLFICPITEVEPGHNKFIVMRDCGCILSERGFTELTRNETKLCVVCDKELPKKYWYPSVSVSEICEEKEKSYIPLAGSVEIVDELREIMMKKRVKSLEKKNEKRKNTSEDGKKKRSKTVNTNDLIRQVDNKNQNTSVSLTTQMILTEAKENVQKISETIKMVNNETK